MLFDYFDIDKAVLIGLSMGGTVAQRVVLHSSGKNVLGAIESLGVARSSQTVIDKPFSL